MAQDEEGQSLLEKISWLEGPATATMDNLAEIRVPGGYLFANGDDTKMLIEAMGNISSGEEKGFFAPQSMDWFVVFEFDDIGYVKDDEKNSLDADAMLESIREGTEAANEIRRERGFSGMTILGWETPPYYNENTQNLEWAIKGQNDDGSMIINHNTRILGRSGVMRVTLVVDPDMLSSVLPLFREYMKGFSYLSGEQYAEYREGDKLAEYGLTALVVGGAAAVAVKSGLGKWIWKILLLAVAGISGFIKKFFKKKPETEADE